MSELIGWVGLRRPAVRLSVCRPHSLNIFSSETTGGRLKPNFIWGTKVCSNGPGHMTKMAVMPMYGKNLKRIFFSGTKRPMTLKLGMQLWVLEYYQVYSNDDHGLTLTYFTARSNLVPYAFVWEKGKTMKFSETIVIYDLKLATDDRSGKKFLLTSKLVPWGLYAACTGAIYMYKIMKKLYKIRLQRNVFETCKNG